MKYVHLAETYFGEDEEEQRRRRSENVAYF
jgi:hypothetical protein